MMLCVLLFFARAEEPIDPVSSYLGDGDEIRELEKSLHMAKSMQLREFVKQIVRRKLRHELKQDGVTDLTVRQAQKSKEYLNRLYELVSAYPIPQVNTPARMNLLKTLIRPSTPAQQRPRPPRPPKKRSGRKQSSPRARSQ